MQRRAVTILGALFFLLLVPAVSGAAMSDSTSQVYRFTLKDGSAFVGTITASSPDSLRIQMGSGITLTLPRGVVSSIDRLRGTIEGGEYRRVDPNGSRLLFGPTARPLRAGEGYFAAYEIFFTYAAVGIADVLSFGGGLTLLPGASDQIFYLAPKLAFTTQDEMFSAGVGALYLNTFSSENDALGIVYGIGTYGTPRAGLTLGLGYGYSEGEFASNPVILLGGEVQVSNSFKLITENWFPVGSDVSLLSFGFRFFGDNIAADLGFFYPMENGEGISEGFPFLPWLGFAYNFGR
jgi:hypothetical protein